MGNRIPDVDPTRQVCYNCQHWPAPISDNTPWGECEVANNSMFSHCLRDGVRYTARHSKARTYNNKGCKTRFVSAHD